MRIDFEDLPAPVLAAVEERTGPILKVEAVGQGFNSEIGARIVTESGTRFVKGLRADHKRVWTQRREADVNPLLPGIAPALLWHIGEGEWDLLVFESLEGHHADYSPESPDLPKVAELLRRLGRIECPDIELRLAEQRLSRYVNHTSDLDYFVGNSLLHTDLNNTNVLVDDTAYLVDWAWATRGAAWLDACYWGVWLIAAGGHRPDKAERWAASIPAWHTAPAEGVTAFAEASANVWEEIAGDGSDPWTADVFNASHRWAEHRKAV